MNFLKLSVTFVKSLSALFVPGSAKNELIMRKLSLVKAWRPILHLRTLSDI